MNRGDIEQNTQDEVQPKIRLYNTHKVINEEKECDDCAVLE